MAKEKVKILDGSYGFQLNKHLEKPIDNDPLWSAKALITNPEAVVATHMDYIKAGADIIETNTYQASILGFKKYLDLSEEEGFKVICKAVQLTKQAISQCKQLGFKEPCIAGSVGPYGAYLHDGSEYTGNYTDFVTDEELINYHEPRIKAFIQEEVDLIAIETIPSKREALVILDIVKKFPFVKVWVSFSCKSDGVSTAHNDNFKKTALEVYNSNKDQIIAVGVNCIAPHLVESFIKKINVDSEDFVPLIVYPNSGEHYDPKTGWDNNSEQLIENIPKWLDCGVRIIGGCCRVCANDTEKIINEVRKWENHHL